jgi:SpoIID/LytB domain protein
VRGEVEAYDYDGNGTPKERELNIIRLQQYLGDVVPSESSAGWGEVGGAGPQSEPWGFQELEAQAVAARTYALAYEAAGGWYGYASICDNYFCQAYPGITNESAVSTAAVADTARQYLTLDGRPAETEYSASTGGYTVESSFPAVPDAGDAVCLTNTGLWTCNPEHTWNVTISVSQLESALPSIGTLNSISITARNGLGSLGGRVLSITVSGAKGSVTESGTAFQYQFGLYSDWFAITNETTSGTPRRISSGGAEFSRGTGPLP